MRFKITFAIWLRTQCVNSLSLAKCGKNLKRIFFNVVLEKRCLDNCGEFALGWIIQGPTNEKSTLVDVLLLSKILLPEANVDPSLCHHMALLGHSDLICTHSSNVIFVTETTVCNTQSKFINSKLSNWLNEFISCFITLGVVNNNPLELIYHYKFLGKHYIFGIKRRWKLMALDPMSILLGLFKSL